MSIVDPDNYLVARHGSFTGSGNFNVLEFGDRIDVHFVDDDLPLNQKPRAKQEQG